MVLRGEHGEGTADACIQSFICEFHATKVEGSTVVILCVSPQHFDFLVATCSKSVPPANRFHIS